MRGLYNDNPLKRELIKFVFIGAFITILSIFLIWIFYFLFQMGYWGSSAASYFVCSVLSLILNKKITFKNHDSFLRITPKFFFNITLSYVIAYLIARPSMKYILIYFNIENFQIIEQYSLLIGVALFSLLNFFGQKYFVFKKEVY